MAPLSIPSDKGTYRIKVLGDGRCLEYDATDSVIQLAAEDPQSTKQQWLIVPNPDGSFKISNATAGAGLIYSDDTQYQKFSGYGYPLPQVGTESRDWAIKASSDNTYSKIQMTVGNSTYVWDNCFPDTNTIHMYKNVATGHPNQCYVFELVSGGGGGSSGGPAGPTFEKLFFPLTVKDAKTYQYDIIVIGTGIGGGIVAGDLFDRNSQLGSNAKSILVIEKGGLVFHSHCLNAARPAGLGQDRGQQNDTFFAKFKTNYNLTPDTNAKDIKAGPMYMLGGRSAAWGLFVPRIHDLTLSRIFTPNVKNAILSTYYRQAETLMNLSLPTTRPVHQDLMERLNANNDPEVQWQWGRIASEFKDQKNFDFADGAYSTIDKLLEIAMSKPIINGVEEEHKNYKILLRTEVRQILWDPIDTSRATGVRVRDEQGVVSDIYIKDGGQVVLGAGSVQSAAILLRSGKKDFLKNNRGLHITDHDIFAGSSSFQYNNPKSRDDIGAVKIQTYTKLTTSQNYKPEITLINMSIDASSFLPRDNPELFNDYPKWIIAFIRPCELNEQNYVDLDANDEPIIKFNRNKPFTDSLQDADMKQLWQLTTSAVNTMTGALDISFIGESMSTTFKPLEMGGVAHELGTIPMKRYDGDTGYCLEENLRLRDHQGLYVCDLSVFSASPESNPSLTLGALALRLSREILLPLVLPDASNLQGDFVYVINHSGQTVKVFVGNRSQINTSRENDDVILEPGAYAKWQRTVGFVESVYIFKLAYNSTNSFLNTPEFKPATAGQITVID